MVCLGLRARVCAGVPPSPPSPAGVQWLPVLLFVLLGGLPLLVALRPGGASPPCGAPPWYSDPNTSIHLSDSSTTTTSNHAMGALDSAH